MKPGEWKNNGIDDVNFMIYAGHGLKKGTYYLEHNSLHYFTMNSFTNYHISDAISESNYHSSLLTTEAVWGKKERRLGGVHCLLAIFLIHQIVHTIK